MDNVELGKVIKPRKEKASPADFPDLQFIGMEHVESHTMRLLGTVPATTMRSAANRFYAGDVLYGRLRPYLNKVYKPNFDGLCSAEFIVFPKNDRIDSDFLRYRLNAHDFVAFASHLNTGDRPRVDFDGLSSFNFLLPSTTDKQKEIVAEIDKQFSCLDEAVAALKRIQASLKRYKAAVLKAAVEGKLTEQWRREHSDVEPADQLLNRILAERRSNWEAEELAKMKAKGLKQRDDSWKKKYKEPSGPDTANLPELPAGWVWVSAYAVCKITSGFAFKSNQFTDTGAPAIKIANVSYGQFLWKQQEYLPESWLEKYLDFQVHPGEILLALTRPITDDSVKVCVYPFDAPIGLLNQRVALLKVIPGYDKKYLLYLMQSEQLKNQIKSGLSETLQPNLSPLDLQLFSVPLPSEVEQSEIVAEIDRRLSVTEELEGTIESNLKRAERLRQTILQRAFAGGVA